MWLLDLTLFRQYVRWDARMDLPQKRIEGAITRVHFWDFLQSEQIGQDATLLFTVGGQVQVIATFQLLGDLV